MSIQDDGHKYEETKLQTEGREMVIQDGSENIEEIDGDPRYWCGS